MINMIYWKPLHIPALFQYITIPNITLPIIKILKRIHPTQFIFYLPQVVQIFHGQNLPLLSHFLLQYSQQSVLFQHQLIWIAKVESKIDLDHKRKQEAENPNDQLQQMIEKGLVSSKQLELTKNVPVLVNDLIRQMTDEQKNFFNKLNNFFESVTAISGKLYP